MDLFLKFSIAIPHRRHGGLLFKKKMELINLELEFATKNLELTLFGVDIRSTYSWLKSFT